MDRHCKLLFFCIFQLLCRFCFGNQIHNITSSQPLSQAQTLVSPSQVFELGFFAPNGSASQFVGIWYKQIFPRTVVWVANRENPLMVTDSGASLTVASDGNLVLIANRSRESVVIWSTNVNVRSNRSTVVLLDNGDLVLEDGTSGEALWQSFYRLSDTFLPGAELGFNTRTGDNYVLTSWKSDSDPSPGSFTFGISAQSPPEGFIWTNNGSTPHWRSGPWDKSKFIGIPQMDAKYQSSLALQQDLDEGTTFLYFNMYNNSIITKVFLTPQGVLRELLRDKTQNGDWYFTWEAPKSPCDLYAVCGPFGVCKASKSPICECLEGFVPKSDQEWRHGNWTAGCERRTELPCDKNVTNSKALPKGNKDVFFKVGKLKVPDFYEYVDVVDDVNGCLTWCLNNCSCLAYAYVNGIGCLVWSDSLIDIQEFSFGGEDLFVRLAQAELASGHKVRNTIISLTAIFSGSAFFMVIVFNLRRRRSKLKSKNMRGCTKLTDDTSIDKLQIYKEHDPSELRVFNLDTILVATNHFSPMNKLGQGGFGSVYKGKLQDGTEIAVKRLSSSSGQGIEEFKTETSLIAKLQHRNLVKLYGCSIEEEEKLLVYELVPNRSLDHFIFDQRRSAHLNWATRFNIIHGVAKGLLYLHRDSCLRVIHRDLKVSNILLDEKMNPKISDFGLARIFQGTFDLINTRRVVGTLGYMAPEYAIGGIFSEKSDVFSFGVVLLEIVSGRKNTSFNYYDQHLSLIGYAWQLWSESRGLDLVDEALAKSCCASEAINCIQVGLLCVQDHATERPSMPDVVLMLSNEKERPQPKQPMFAFHSSPMCEIQKLNGSKGSVNEATVSLIEGR